jgi:carboxypeptidase D
MDKCTHAYTTIAPGANPPGIGVCERVMHAVLASHSKEVNGVKMCMNSYDIRLMDTWPACGMNWPPDLEQITPWLRVCNLCFEVEH